MRQTITSNALLKRINRKLKPEMEAVRKTRGVRALLNLGQYYTYSFSGGYVLEKDTDLAELGRTLGVLESHEVVAGEK